MHLPLEIWREVFTYACTDGGYTGASLALVCKLFYNASHQVRFRSLSFYSLDQIEYFLEYVQRCEGRFRGAQPKVYHLLLSFSQTSSDGRSDAEFSPGAVSHAYCTDADAWATARRLRQHEKAMWDHKFLQLVPALLELVAPHLRTLALLQSDGHTVPALRNALPRLRELTLLVGISAVFHGDPALDPSGRSAASPPSPDSTNSPESSSLWDADGVEARVSATPSSPHARFPALERLHLVCGRLRDFRLRDALAYVPRHAPALTHLRISNATYTHAQCIPAFLCAVLGVPAPEFECVAGTAAVRFVRIPPRSQTMPVGGAGDDWDVGVKAGLPGLRRVIVHSVLPLPGARCGSPYMEYTALMNAVDAVDVACDKAAGVSVHPIRSDRQKHRYWEVLVTRQWMERIEDGRGCWVGGGPP
ncbi:hypothetical protein PYCCODRAFT_755594 [Trametes coccinea BRFM310]|uniref:F-box domain-containing protein n=1 Tax=Trametes coccinea (strain BRFM310) TaxID=1353009 RepID=A0A1Y2IZZ7_TRAC3|nr:hypothetical protein PYCCODRAFT_755594 [Trametes coccinea BRFM310]